MKIPRKELRTVLRSIYPDETADRPNVYAIALTINGRDYLEIFEVDADGSVIGDIGALEPRWWAIDIILSYLKRVARGESLRFPVDLGDLGDPALARKARD